MLPNNDKIVIDLRIANELMADTKKAFRIDNQCVTIQEFCRYALRLFNECLLERIKERAANERISDNITDYLVMDGEDIRDIMYSRYGKIMWGNHRSHQSVERSTDMTLTITKQSYEDIINIRSFFGIKTMNDYVSIALMWIVSLFSDIPENEDDNNEMDKLLDKMEKKSESVAF